MKYRVLIEQDEDGIYVVEVPTLPGCISQGKTREEALANIKAHLERRGGWFFIDKIFTHIETTTVEDLLNASVITITNVIIGGNTDSIDF